MKGKVTDGAQAGQLVLPPRSDAVGRVGPPSILVNERTDRARFLLHVLLLLKRFSLGFPPNGHFRLRFPRVPHICARELLVQNLYHYRMIVVSLFAISTRRFKSITPCSRNGGIRRHFSCRVLHRYSSRQSRCFVTIFPTSCKCLLGQ